MKNNSQLKLFGGGRGRPRSLNPIIKKTVGLTAADWEWLEKWQPGASPSAQLREALSRARKFWPGGPAVFR